MSLSKTPFILASLAALLPLGGCHGSQPDYSPVGDGMKAIGISLVVYGVVQALACLVLAENTKPKDRPPKSRKTRENNQEKGGESK